MADRERGVRVMIAAGGTGGHVFPALAVAEALAARGARVDWVGTARGLEARLVPEAGLPLHTLPVRALRGRGAAAWLAAPFALARPLAAALALVRRLRPQVVLGMGGYAAGPAGLAAWLMRRPLVVHEQNAVPGLTNRLLAPLARRVLAGFPDAFPPGPRVEVTGNPVRAAIAALPPPEARWAARSGPPRLLVLGGSQGARALNEALPAALARLGPGERPEVRHQAGARAVEAVRAAYAHAGVAAEVTAFVEDMAEAYGWADLVVARAGALTVAELAAAGLGALLVPYPHAVDDHQRANARWLERAGAAEVVREPLDPERLAGRLRALLADRAGLLARAQAARRLARPDAAARVAEACLEAAR